MYLALGLGVPSYFLATGAVSGRRLLVFVLSRTGEIYRKVKNARLGDGRRPGPRWSEDNMEIVGGVRVRRELSSVPQRSRITLSLGQQRGSDFRVFQVRGSVAGC